MAKKIFLTTIFVILFGILFTTISLAESSNTTVSLGNEVTTSMNKTEKSMDDFADDTNLDKAGQNIKNGVSTGMNKMGETIEDLMGDDDKNDMKTSTSNRAVAGTTGSYTTGETTEITGRNGMTKNAWIWIVMVVVALIIVATVWFYAIQQ